jgi:hypothetical protein
MTESSFPFEGAGVAVATPPPTDDLPGGNESRTKLLLLLGGVALLVVGALVYFLLLAGGGDDSDPAAAPEVPASQGDSVVNDEPAEEAAPTVKKQSKSAKSFGRDPFAPLIVEAESTTESVAPAAPVTGTSGATTTGTVTGTSGATGDTTTQPETTSPSATTAHRFKVVDVAPDNSRISVKVDGEFYRNLKAGEVFAKYFKVRFIGGAVNDFQYGEETFKVVGAKAVSIG